MGWMRAGLASGAAIAGLGVWALPAAAAIECGDTITTDKKLKADLDCPATDGVIIGATGVSLDLNGHRITGGGGGAGVRTQTGVNAVKVFGGKIRGFGTSVLIDGGSNSTVRKLNIGGAPDDAIRLDGVFNATVSGNLVGGSPNNGILARASSVDLKVANNEVRGANAGILIEDVSTATVSENLVGGDPANGIIVQAGSSLVKVQKNEVRGGNDAGIALVGGTGLSAIENDVIGTNGVLVAAQQAKVKANSVSESTGNGIFVDAFADGARLLKNTLLDNGTEMENVSGIAVAGGADEVVVDRNVAKRNTDDGIHVNDDDTLIVGNVANGNDDKGIESLSDNGSGNVAKNNGGPEQCIPASLCT